MLCLIGGCFIIYSEPIFYLRWCGPEDNDPFFQAGPSTSIKRFVNNLTLLDFYKRFLYDMMGVVMNKSFLLQC